MAELSSALREAFAQHDDDPDHREAIIVTIEPGCSVGAVDGFEVQHSVRSGTIVIGAATERAVQSLVDREGVVRVERDSGDMRTLDS